MRSSAVPFATVWRNISRDILTLGGCRIPQDKCHCELDASDVHSYRRIVRHSKGRVPERRWRRIIDPAVPR
jgi:hypothetical protein